MRGVLLAGLMLGVFCGRGFADAGGEVKTQAAPAGERLSQVYTVTAGGKDVPVYTARVASADREGYARKMDAKLDPATFCAETAFASFDLSGSAAVVVTCTANVTSAKLLPEGCGTEPVIDGRKVTLNVDGPRKLVLEVNGDEIGSLNLFANPMEDPAPSGPNVIYYGPGIHEVDCVNVTSGQIVYVADGAIVREKPAGNGSAAFVLSGTGIELRGRGIIDGSLCPAHSRSLVLAQDCVGLKIEGVILRDASGWTMPLRRCEGFAVDNVKIFGYRANSDGIDICNCQDARVSDCFLRTWDDLVVVKADKGQGKVEHITVSKCVLWNELAHALSIGAELREDIDKVVFRDCDIIHDKGREWTLRIYNCDSARVSNVIFDDIRIAESRRLASLWIGNAVWSKETERGHIEHVIFRNIRVGSGTAQVESKGYDAGHLVDHVLFDHVTLPGGPLRMGNIQQNEFSRDLIVTVPWDGQIRGSQ